MKSKKSSDLGDIDVDAILASILGNDKDNPPRKHSNKTKKTVKFTLDSQKSPRFPLVEKDFDLVQEAPQLLAKTATPKKPILVTFGLANRIGIVAYSEENDFAFLAHSDTFHFC